MKKLSTLLVCFLIFTSCATQIAPIAAKKRNFNDTKLNQTITRDIGTSLYTKGEELYQEAYILKETPQPFRIKLLDFPYVSGDVIPLAGETADYFLYYKSTFSQGQMQYTSGIAENKLNGSVVPFTNSANGFGVKENQNLKLEKTTITKKDCNKCFKQEFIFNGKSDNNAKFIYREYINNMARPSFNQEVQYDLNESNTVGFKGLRIEIIKITNTSIKYKILNDFSN